MALSRSHTYSLVAALLLLAVCADAAPTVAQFRKELTALRAVVKQQKNYSAFARGIDRMLKYPDSMLPQIFNTTLFIPTNKAILRLGIPTLKNDTAMEAIGKYNVLLRQYTGAQLLKLAPNTLLKTKAKDMLVRYASTGANAGKIVLGPPSAPAAKQGVVVTADLYTGKRPYARERFYSANDVAGVVASGNIPHESCHRQTPLTTGVWDGSGAVPAAHIHHPLRQQRGLPPRLPTSRWQHPILLLRLLPRLLPLLGADGVSSVAGRPHRHLPSSSSLCLRPALPASPSLRPLRPSHFTPRGGSSSGVGIRAAVYPVPGAAAGAVESGAGRRCNGGAVCGDAASGAGGDWQGECGDRRGVVVRVGVTIRTITNPNPPPSLAPLPQMGGLVCAYAELAFSSSLVIGDWAT
ncbi:unnamed protein product [Closterium sp. NIES-54]